MRPRPSKPSLDPPRTLLAGCRAPRVPRPPFQAKLPLELKYRADDEEYNDAVDDIEGGQDLDRLLEWVGATRLANAVNEGKIDAARLLPSGVLCTYVLVRRARRSPRSVPFFGARQLRR